MMDLLSVPPRCVVFDLDGTLINSIDDIADSVNSIRTERGAEPCSREHVRSAVGHGARVLCDKILPDILQPDEPMEQLFHQFRANYCRIASDHSRDIGWLPGTIEFLDHLRATDVPMAILTNKPRSVTDQLLPRLDLQGPWQAVICPEDAGIPKPDPAGLLSILHSLDCSVEDAIMVGDSAVDFATGIAAGVRTVGRRGGYGIASPPEPDVWVDQLVELIEQ
jgi:phosphoglycolate phosphatase